MVTVSSLSKSTSEILQSPENIKRWTVGEYHQLSELGLLKQDEKTELIAGQIVLAAKKSPPHVTTRRLIAQQLNDFLRDKPFFVRAQDPIELNDLSEPEPDLVIVKGNILTYAEHHPQPQDVCLVVEVADTTLRQGCNVKDKLYAQANIKEYWVIDIPN